VGDVNYYEILGVAEDAHYDAIDEAYWSRVRAARFAPDAEPYTLQMLNEAYEVLRTPSLRTQYDAACRATTEVPRPEPARPLIHVGLTQRLPWGKAASQEREAAAALVVARLEREVHTDRERLRATLETGLDTDGDASEEEQSRLMRIFGLLREP
jgi:curved DNA-binding protein CbpA